MAKSFLPNTANIREANRSDLSSLKRMIEALAVYHDDVPQITLEILKRDVFGIAPWIYVLVADMDGRAVGYTALCPTVQLQVGIRGMDMHHLFVEPDFRGHGIGKQIIEAARQKARTFCCQNMSVGTDPDNAKAQAFYLACGFERKDSSNPKFRIVL